MTDVSESKAVTSQQRVTHSEAQAPLKAEGYFSHPAVYSPTLVKPERKTPVSKVVSDLKFFTDTT